MIYAHSVHQSNCYKMPYSFSLWSFFNDAKGTRGGGHFDGKMCGGWGEFLGMEGLVGGV